ncbi:XdhC family protein [Rhizobium sp. CF142]|uniref:XdhC family protein n=1 Tax=Rhizobium sp. CF142 TaxID=1144314 RepID=UPI00026EF456|nr:XdhC family protein [Rhizobium sp. CF142]EJJ29508.1 xanthine and CO dehydrogenases maturation factor, XdhC/CoxF family [Rhizobium sp. CF142]
MLISTYVPTPVRDRITDDPADILQFAINAYQDGAVALATLVEIRGGAARALGSQVAVAIDGRFCGYVSGGCVEAAVAHEALQAIAEGADRTVKFGDGSPFFDIVLPCGGGITVAIHVLRDVEVLEQVIEQLQQRNPASLRYSPERQLLDVAEPAAKTAWINEQFITVYRPATRVLISGQSVEACRLAGLAKAAGYAVVQPEFGESGKRAIDPFTAVVMLHHDLEAELAIMDAALGSPAFYIGALGSTRTHRRRVERLQGRGWDLEDINRIKAPIGSFGPTKDSASLALSILGDIAATRLTVFG